MAYTTIRTTASDGRVYGSMTVDGKHYEIEHKDGVLVAAYLGYWHKRNGWCYRGVAESKLPALHAQIIESGGWAR